MKLNVEKVGLDIQELNKSLVNCAVVTHNEKGHHYQIVKLVKSKHPDTGDWYESVIYRQIESGEFFVRSVDSFINNFTKIIDTSRYGIELQVVKILKEIKL